MSWPVFLLWSALFGCAESPPAVRPPPAVAAPDPVEPPVCLGTPPCEDERAIEVDLARVGGQGVATVAYDHAEVVRRVRLARMGEESDLSVAVRLLLGEVGAERLLANQHAMEEALAVLATVRNRLDPAVWNPEQRPAAPWPGCEAGARFAECARPDQYLGLRAWRALHPEAHVPADQLEPAVVVAVTAWWLLSTDAAEDPTGGAVSFVHRCGGEAYGQPTTHCDGAGEDDVEGAHPSTGPVVFRGPLRWDPEQGRYLMWRKHQVEYAAR